MRLDVGGGGVLPLPGQILPSRRLAGSQVTTQLTVHASGCDSVAEEIYLLHTKDTLVFLDDQAIGCQQLKDLPEVVFLRLCVCAGH